MSEAAITNPSDLSKLVGNAKETILSMAVNDRFVLEFIKKDGTLRELAGTFTPPKDWKPKGPGLKYSPRMKGLLQVWDLDKEGWRMVNVLTLHKINGTDFVIDIRACELVKVPSPVNHG